MDFFLFHKSKVCVRSLPAIMLMTVSCLAETAEKIDFIEPKEITKILYENCNACHDEWEQEGDIRLDQLGKIELGTRLNILNKIQEQLHFKHMPPKKEEIQPTAAERTTLLKWANNELKKHNASKLEEKLRMPNYANYVDHDELFSGKHKHLKSYTPDRRWLVSEYIFDAKINRLLDIRSSRKMNGGRHPLIGGKGNAEFKIINPFLLPPDSGVRYYANTSLNGGHLLSMVSNAKNLSIQMTDELGRKNKDYLPAYRGIMESEYKDLELLAKRKEFLSNFIEPVLIKTYGRKKHESLLPHFNSIAPKRIALKKEQDKVNVPKASLTKENSAVVARTIQKYENKNKSDDELILACEIEWFYRGHDPRQILARIVFLQNHMPYWLSHMKRYNLRERRKAPAYKPLSDDEMQAIKKTLQTFRKQGDDYQSIIDKCVGYWEKSLRAEREKNGEINAGLLVDMVSQSFQKLNGRAPTPEESKEYVATLRSDIREHGRLKSVQKLLQVIILRSEFVYREEFGAGKPDEHGRRMLSPFHASYALAYALTDSGPDQELVEAVRSGKLETRADYHREVTRMLKKRDQHYIVDPSLKDSYTNLPIRKLRFFREFFGYPNMLTIFKDNKRFGGNHTLAQERLVIEADMLIEHILKEDKNVIETLLNTEDFYVYHSGDETSIKFTTDNIREMYLYFKDKPWNEFTFDDLIKHQPFLEKAGMSGLSETKANTKKRTLSIFKMAMTNLISRYASGQTYVAPYHSWGWFGGGKLSAKTQSGQKLESVQVSRYFNLSIPQWDYPVRQPFKVKHRKGMLTHPAWLIAHAQNTETDPVIRGKWIREKLLAGTIPDIPITVDAVVPEDHHKTLRSRLVKATEKKYCWRCHEQMNPLGYAFEIYDDFGRFRTEESIEHPENLIKKGPDKGRDLVDIRDTFKTLPVKAEGHLAGTGDQTLDGKVRDALDLADRLSRSDRVRQSVIRYAFRYFMGRNEGLSDSKTLIDADKAYLESGGSFDAVIVSLLTSDSFIYRKSSTPIKNN